jgi:hypothetical protein
MKETKKCASRPNWASGNFQWYFKNADKSWYKISVSTIIQVSLRQTSQRINRVMKIFVTLLAAVAAVSAAPQYFGGPSFGGSASNAIANSQNFNQGLCGYYGGGSSSSSGKYLNWLRLNQISSRHFFLIK